jgi:hypothetical protein
MSSHTQPQKVHVAFFTTFRCITRPFGSYPLAF